MVEFVLHGRVPSKKNSKTIVCRGRRPLLLSSEAYLAWHMVSSQELATYKLPHDIKKCKVIATFYAPDNRRADLSNKWESIGDLLVDNGILSDDSWQVVHSIALEYAGIDKDNPRVIIKIV